MTANAPAIPATVDELVLRYGRVFRAPAGQQWQRLEIPGENGAVLFHWADLPLAFAWLRFAQNVINDPTLWSAPLSYFPNPPTRLAFAYELALGSLAQCCNALNIQWHALPELRAVYRRFFAGEPDGWTERDPRGPATRAPLYAKTANYADNWWRGSEGEMPVAMTTDPQRGVFARRAVELTQRALGRDRVRVPLDFVLTVTPFLASDAERSAGFSELSAPSLLNEFRGQSLGRSLYGRARPDAAECRLLRESARGGSISAWRPCPAREGSQPFPDAPGVVRWLWADAGPEANNPRPQVDRSAPPVCFLPPEEFLPYVRELISAMLRETQNGTAMERAIFSSRSYVARFNQDAATANGGLADWLSLVADRDADVRASQTRTTPGVQAAAAALQAVGASLSGPTLGLSSLIAGAISSIISVVDRLSPKGVEGIGRDDLGRFKPIFERGWLSGDPSQTDPARGAPAFSVPSAPEFVRATAPAGTRLTVVSIVAGLPAIYGPSVVAALENNGLSKGPGAIRRVQSQTVERVPNVGFDVLVRAPATVLLTNDSTGVVSRTTWADAGAYYQSDGVHVRVIEHATQPESQGVTVSKEEFCGLNPAHPLCTDLDTNRPRASSSKSSSFPIGAALVVAAGIGAAWLLVRRKG